jgi:hypothetical protein
MRIFIFYFLGSAASAGVSPLIEAPASAERRRSELSLISFKFCAAVCSYPCGRWLSLFKTDSEHGEVLETGDEYVMHSFECVALFVTGIKQRL